MLPVVMKMTKIVTMKLRSMIKVSKRTATPLDQIPIIEVSEKIRMSHSVKVESEQIGGNS